MSYNCAIVGLGAISKNHARAILKCSSKIVAACDTDIQKLQNFCDEYNCEGFDSFDKMLENSSIDALHICTPHFLHFEMIEKAVEKNIAVFVEKPPVTTKDQLDKLTQLSEKGKICVCFQNRFNETTEFVKDLILSGKYGNLVGANATVNWNRKDEYYTKSDWRGRIEKECGSVLINQSIHTLDLLCYLLGTPKLVNASVLNMATPYIETEDTVTAIIDFDDKRATFFATVCAASSPPATICLQFENAYVRFDGKSVSVFEKNLGTKDFNIKSVGKDCWGSSHEKLIDLFYKTLETEQNPMPVTDCLDTMNLLFDIYKRR